MKRVFLFATLGVALMPAASRGQQQVCIHFAQTADPLDGATNACGSFVNPIDPTPADAYAIRFSVPHGGADRGRIYYTSDGTDPGGILGDPTGTTQVIDSSVGCTFGSAGSSSDVLTASIPALPLNTTVTFILSFSGNAIKESFLGSGDGACDCGSSGCAQRFQYVVMAAGPRPVDDVIMVVQDTPRTLASPGVMVNDRRLVEGVVARPMGSPWEGKLSLATDGSLTYTPSPSFVGDDVATYQLWDGELGSTAAQITFKVRPAQPLAAVSSVSQVEGCPGSAKRISRGLDNGTNGAIPLDGVLQESEITDVTYICDGVAGSGGAAGAQGTATLIRMTKEPAGDNCAAGGQKVEVGVDANADGVLADAEVTSQTFVCDGAKGKSGCSAAPGALSILGALGALSFLGAMRRRRGAGAGAGRAELGGEER